MLVFPVGFALPNDPQAQSDSWKSEIVADALPENYGGESSAYRMPCEAPSGSWSSLGHRRVHSAPNIMAGIEAPPQAGTRWRGDSVPWHAPDVLTRNLRDHAIPEGRRFEVRIVFAIGVTEVAWFESPISTAFIDCSQPLPRVRLDSSPTIIYV